MRLIRDRLNLLALILSTLTGMQSADAASVKMTTVKYGTNATYQALDIYTREDLAKATTLVFIHSGALESGDKNLYGDLGRLMAGEHDCVTVIINYRLSPTYKHPTHVQDAAKAIGWTYRHISQYGGDPAGIFVMGHSAGGYLTALLGTDDRYLKNAGMKPSVIKGLVMLSGIYDASSLPFFYNGFLMDVFGTLDKATLKAASPQTYVDTSLAPFRLFYADQDLSALPKQATVFAKALGKVKAEYKITKLMFSHTTEISCMMEDPIGCPDTVQKIVDFIAAHPQIDVGAAAD